MSARVIQVRPSRNPRWQKQDGWEVFEAEGVCPVYCDEPARDSALSYARQRAGYGRAEIQVLDENWNVVETITNARGFEADGVSLTGVTLTFRHKYRARARNVFGSVRAGRLRRQVRYG